MRVLLAAVQAAAQANRCELAILCCLSGRVPIAVATENESLADWRLSLPALQPGSGRCTAL